MFNSVKKEELKRVQRSITGIQERLSKTERTIYGRWMDDVIGLVEKTRNIEQMLNAIADHLEITFMNIAPKPAKVMAIPTPKKDDL